MNPITHNVNLHVKVERRDGRESAFILADNEHLVTLHPNNMITFNQNELELIVDQPVRLLKKLVPSGGMHIGTTL